MPENQNPFAGGPAGDERYMFGTFSLRANKINLVKGASYVEKDLLTKDGDVYEFRGKQRAADGYMTHTILVLKCRRRDGGEYLAFREFLYRESDAAQQIAGPALREHFGQNLERIWGKEVEAKVEVVSFQDRGYDKQTFKVVEVFTDRATREAAEQAHFAQFSSPEPEPQTGEEIAESMPWDEPAVESAPVGMPLDQAVTLLQPLWLSSGKNPSQFHTQLAGMPVLAPHFGETVEKVAQAPEVMITVIGEMSCDQAVNFLPSLWLSSDQDADTLYKVLASMPALIPHFGRTPEEFIQIPEIAKLVGGQALQPEEGI